jgi:hypothetical protein
MGLRDALQKSVASCAPKQMQRATFTENIVTSTATTAQQNPANPHEIRVLSATGTATPTQQGQKHSATQAETREKLRVAFATPRNTQLLSLTAHRLAKEVIAAAMRRCDQFNDSDQARADMRQQLMELSPAMQADLLDHFNGKPVNFD